jgi:hypothetical protein
VNAIVDLAKGDPRIVATPEQWGADPRLLNTPGGVVDLNPEGSATITPVTY